MTEVQLEAMRRILEKANADHETLSTREERELRRNLADQLEKAELANASFHARSLIHVGIRHVDEYLETLLESDHAEAYIESITKFAGQKRNTDNILLAVEKASRIVKALKTYVHGGGKGEISSCDVRDSMETVLTIYQNKLKHGIEVIKRFDEVPEIKAYVDELNQVWTNLIHNAIQAMNNSGILTIEIFHEAGHVVVGVSDTGVGMSKEGQERIFEPFFTTKPLGEGTGLGLDIVRQIVNKHKGSIQVNSEPGKGSSFYIRLPLNHETESDHLR